MLKRIFWSLVMLSLLGVLAVGAGGVYLLHYYSQDLPDHDHLANYEPPTVTRVHAGDGRLLAEFAKEKRVFVPIEAMPLRVIRAFLSAEDKNFYEHNGLDFPSILRAVIVNIENLGKDRRPIGASTITQQVAKNFLLTNEVSIARKIREAMVALRIEETYSKDRILELYLNEIYLGYRSYGAAAAALNYFNKSLDELSIGEAAYLAALPKAPNNYHPIRRREAAISRRNWVVGRMLEDGHITAAEAEAAQAEPLEIRSRGETEVVEADFFAEEVRRELISLYGEDGLYGGGLSVRTTLAPRLQAAADKILREGLIAYDRRHGWRGPIEKIELVEGDWRISLDAVGAPGAAPGWELAAVLEVGDRSATIGLKAGGEGRIPMSEMRWAREWRENQRVGAAPRRPSDVLEAGDVVLVEAVAENSDGEAYPEGSFALRQIPDVDGALVAIDPHTGRVLAMSGGFSYAKSEFNRATQALRQPGSSFKPFVYLAGLESGLRPTTVILDAPFVIDQGPGLGKWKPSNYTDRFYGPTPLRIGIEKSRNLMTVRLAQTVGMDKVVDYAQRFGVIDDMPPLLSMSLGSVETTVLRMTTAYAMLVNGGRRITPSLIDRIQDRHGRTVYRHDARDCQGCSAAQSNGHVPLLPDDRESVADPRHVYQIVSMLQGVVERGTGVRVKAVGKPLAGKTGTTNDSFDSWFVGFSPDLAVGVFAGFDEPRTLGPKETGSSIAAPIFRDFMKEALADAPATPFRVPPGISLVRINPETGQPARPGDGKVILEAFLPGTEPTGGPVPIIRGFGYDQAASGQGFGVPGLGQGGYGGGATLGVNRTNGGATGGFGLPAPGAPAPGGSPVGGGDLDSGLY